MFTLNIRLQKQVNASLLLLFQPQCSTNNLQPPFFFTVSCPRLDAIATHRPFIPWKTCPMFTKVIHVYPKLDGRTCMVKCSSNCIYQVTACCPCEGLQAELHHIFWDSTTISCVKMQSEYDKFNCKRGHVSKAKPAFQRWV